MNKQTLAKILAVTISLSSAIAPISTIAAHEQNTQISSSMSNKTLTNEQLKKEISKLQNEINRQKQILKQKNDSIPGLENKIQQDKVDLKNLKELKFTLDINKTNYEKSIKEANKQYNEVKSKLEEAKSKSSGLTSAEQQRLNELAKIYENEELDGMRFYKSLNDTQLNKYIGYFQNSNAKIISGSVMDMALIDGKDSALSLDNQIASAKLLIKSNEARRQNGLVPVNTSPYTQFLTQIKIEGDKRINYHYQLPEGPYLAENLLLGGDAFKSDSLQTKFNNYWRGCYDEEKAYFDAIVKDLYPGVRLNTIKERYDFYDTYMDELENEASRRNQQIGHYTNLLSSNFDKGTQGMSTANGFVNNTFIDKDYLELNHHSPAISPQQLLNQLEAFKRNDTALRNEYKELLAKKNGQSNQAKLVAQLENQLKELNQKLSRLKSNLDDTEKNLKDTQNKIGNVEQSIKQNTSTLNSTKNEIKSLVEDLNTKIEQINDMKRKIKDYNKLDYEKDPTIPSEPIRFSGRDRVKTSIEVSKKSFVDSNYVILASGANYPDALVSSSLSKILDCPIILTDKDKLRDDVQAELQRLNAKNIILVGGKSSISDKVKSDLYAYNVERIAGHSRYETSSLVYEKLIKLGLKTNDVVVTSGEIFADALSAGSISCKNSTPILLVEKNKIPDCIKKHLKNNNAIIVGGEFSVSKSVQNKIKNSIRLSGKNRYDTSLKVANYAYKNPEKLILASGDDYPDALIASVVSNRIKAPIILSPKNSTDYVKDNINSKIIYIVGGEKSIYYNK
ncbi:MAG: cell wall-binding repeat-containing protein [Finegoldia magna]|uniref:cell wall-binding repeat-containing protein n=1 Tax=Finegoldia magna TaxID=1260 RepID=UPI0039A217AD